MNGGPAPAPVPVEPITLQYAAVPAWDDIIYEPTPGGVRITLRHGGSVIVASIVAAFLLMLLVIPVFILGWRQVLLALGVVGEVLAVIVYAIVGTVVGVLKQTKPTVIEVTADALVFRNVFVQEGYEVIRPRSEVYDVKYVTHSRNLVVRCHTMNMIDCRPVRDEATLRWLAEVLREAMGIKS